MLLVDFLQAFKAGKELKDPATWKQAQRATNAIGSIIICGVAISKFCGYDIHISDAQAFAIAGGVATILGVFGDIMTVATTTKLSFTGKSDGQSDIK